MDTKLDEMGKDEQCNVEELFRQWIREPLPDFDDFRLAFQDGGRHWFGDDDVKGEVDLEPHALPGCETGGICSTKKQSRLFGWYDIAAYLIMVIMLAFVSVLIVMMN